MFVKDWMSKKVVSVDADDSMQEAMSRMREHKIRMMPVLREGRLVGVISDTDIKRASASDATLLDIHEALYLIARIKVREIMTREPVTVPPDFTIEETAELLKTRKISGVPVVKGSGEVVGVITRDDLFNVLISLTGLGKKGILFGFIVEDRPGSIKELTDVIRGAGGRIASILSSYERVPAGSRAVFLRVYDVDRQRLPQVKENLKELANMISFVDHRENIREIYQDLAPL
ncbi:MAG: CBS domain-containing protein [Deltaproteobacteria bacterium]|nr:CBS domain-containing protein [Deltaproteobacteria bacterium]